jgi:hypothetical protein
MAKNAPTRTRRSGTEASQPGEPERELSDEEVAAGLAAIDEMERLQQRLLARNGRETV